MRLNVFVIRSYLHRLIALASGMFMFSGVAFCDELRILTSMPASLFQPFADAFKAQHPGVSVNVLNKNTNAALEEIARGNARRFDIFWASSPEAFAVLSAHNAFSLGTSARTEWRPDRRGQAATYPFALSALGWTQLAASHLPRPREWDDLLDASFTGEIGMTRPSRSGTAHMVVERFLQVRGWDAGWAYLLELSGNLSTITSRSFGVVDGVEKSRFQIGITIDFLAQSRAKYGVAFEYGRPLMVMPAQIGILEQGAAPALAAAFVEFVLSPEGQRILLRPEVQRVPISRQIRAETDSTAPEISAAVRLNWLEYDALLARDRYWAVNMLFDVFITFQLTERNNAWRRLRALQDSTGAAFAPELAAAERLLTTIQIREQDVLESDVNAVPTRVTAFSAATGVQQQAISDWTRAAQNLLAGADEILTEIEFRLDKTE